MADKSYTVGNDIWRTIVICPNCREDNAPNFRFCGMCGTSLEPRRPAGAPGLDPLSAFPPEAPRKVANAPGSVRPVAVENAPRPVSKDVPPISGPSMLGLNQPAANPPGANQTSVHEHSVDVLRERAFSSFDSFLEPEPKSGAGRILLLLVLLAALGGAAWWVYTNYLSTAGNQKAEPATSNTEQASSSEKPSTKSASQDAAPAPDARQSQTPAPSAAVPEGPSENAPAAPDSARKTSEVETKSADEPKPVTPAPAAPKKTTPDKKLEAKRESRVAVTKAPPTPAPASVDTGDAAFRKGESYLYGRGVPENCDEAVKNLKAASTKSNAKARSAFGTMYATGHCVPRDLPTSYSWFALALRADPTNQILEKDLTAVWNQMTPPERQMATRMKQQ
jgi:TPR repeat protein